LWFAFAWIYFGSPLPVTLAVKQNQGTLAISQRFAQGFVTTIKPYTNSWHYPYAAIIAVIGIVYSFVFRREWLLFLTWPVVYFLSFTILGVSRYFWYYAPLVPGFVIAIGLGIAFLIDKLSQLIAGTSSNKSVQKLQLVAITLLLITPLLVKQVNNLYKLSNKIDPRFEIYTAIGKWLAVNTPPDATVGVLEVGIIGYNAERTMIDFAGLLNPQITEQLRADTDYQDAAIWAFSTFNPDYVVLHTDIWPGFEQGYIAERCVNAQRFPGENFGYSQSVDIYQCSY
jgi:hypothetical protein